MLFRVVKILENARIGRARPTKKDINEIVSPISMEVLFDSDGEESSLQMAAMSEASMSVCWLIRAWEVVNADGDVFTVLDSEIEPILQ